MRDDLRVLGYLAARPGANLAATVSDGDVATAVRTVVEPGNNTYLASQTQFGGYGFGSEPEPVSVLMSVGISKRAAWASMSASDKTAYTDPVTGHQYAWYRDGDVELTIPGDWTPGTPQWVYRIFYPHERRQRHRFVSGHRRDAHDQPHGDHPRIGVIAAYFAGLDAGRQRTRAAPRLMCGCSLPASVLAALWQPG